ncbi:PD-(D/E)XK nuclease superfamily protein [Marinobacter litoralis]|uniref:CRISPR-associated exonuclease Cas4 n=1 Tax=Marinobacter litoralis TaxID=187981 RepID=A0A3M2RJT3_9GAMM|nr:CRISPR-associated protein Cas4 [Marinobacter litoralis]RMJ05462.1 PD-(D/E)XK nuclease superfamily protein [Marinobacter litoralis]
MQDEKLIPLSALQHFAFCPRQCALIHNEQAWAENWLTAQGQVLHQRVDRGEPETRKGIRYERGVLVSAESLGITGKLDLVEIELSTGSMKPVEYKRGRPKRDNWDRIQLCAQGLCLEEMRGRPVRSGALWYWQTRHRDEVEFTSELREETVAAIRGVRDLLVSGQTPKAVYEKKCDACSLYDLCNPKLLGRDGSARYVDDLFKEVDEQ